MERSLPSFRFTSGWPHHFRTIYRLPLLPIVLFSYGRSTVRPSLLTLFSVATVCTGLIELAAGVHVAGREAAPGIVEAPGGLNFVSERIGRETREER